MKKGTEILAEIKTESLALYLCCRDRRVPLYAKAPALIAVGLLFSPIDIIPDFIPLLGHLDDIIIIPLLIGLSKKLISPEIYSENRDKALKLLRKKSPVSRIGAVIIITLWLIIICTAAAAAIRHLPKLQAFLRL